MRRFAHITGVNEEIMETQANDGTPWRQLQKALAPIALAVGYAGHHLHLATAMISLTLACLAVRAWLTRRDVPATKLDRLEAILRTLNGALSAVAGIAGAAA